MCRFHPYTVFWLASKSYPVIHVLIINSPWVGLLVNLILLFLSSFSTVLGFSFHPCIVLWLASTSHPIIHVLILNSSWLLRRVKQAMIKTEY